MCLGKVKQGNMAGCVEFMHWAENPEGMSDEYIICIYMGEDNPIIELNVFGEELCKKMFNTIWNMFLGCGYCDLDRFNGDGDYIDYGLLS